MAVGGTAISSGFALTPPGHKLDLTITMNTWSNSLGTHIAMGDMETMDRGLRRKRHRESTTVCG